MPSKERLHFGEKMTDAAPALATQQRSRARWRRRIWRRLITYAPAVVVVAGGVWTVVTWWVAQSDEAHKNQRAREDALRVSTRESQKPFLEKQLQFYFEAARVTAKLATLSPSHEATTAAPENWEWARRRFWELYWGELGVVESPDVAGAMVRFGHRLNEVAVCFERKEANCQVKQATLEGLSLDLAREIRKSIELGWGYSLPNIGGKSQ